MAFRHTLRSLSRGATRTKTVKFGLPLASRAFSSRTLNPPQRASKEDQIRTTLTTNTAIADEALVLHASQEPSQTALKVMLDFWTSADTSVSKLIDSANFLRNELSVRLAHRIVDIHNLPFIVVQDPAFAKQLEIYKTSYEALSSYPQTFTDIKQVEEYTINLQSLLPSHKGLVPRLEQILKNYPKLEALQLFIDRELTSHIGRRLLIEQHVACFESYKNTGQVFDSKMVGIVSQLCHPVGMYDLPMKYLTC